MSEAEEEARWRRLRLPAGTPEKLRIYGPAVLIAAAAFYVAFQFVEPAPPDRLRIYSGDPEGAYYAIAQRYAAALESYGIAAEVVATAGSGDNLARLAEERTDDRASVALVQAGIVPPRSEEGLSIEALSSLYYEPVWLFVREDVLMRDLRDLPALTVAVGPEGSGSRALAAVLYAENGLVLPDDPATMLTGAEASAALILGQVDAVFTVGGADLGMVRELLAHDGIDLLSFRRAEAYARRLDYIEHVRLPEGAVDPGANAPPRPVDLIATTAMLVGRSDLHPALVDLLLSVATEVHSDAGLFEEAGAFPSRYGVSLPLNEDARRWLERGPSFLRRVLPFWAATLIDRWLVMLLPLLTVLLPLLRIVPPLYRWRIRRRITRRYRDLRAIEQEEYGHAEALQRLAAMEEEVAGLKVPETYAAELYGLKFHIQLLKQRLQSLESRGHNT